MPENAAVGTIGEVAIVKVRGAEVDLGHAGVWSHLSSNQARMLAALLLAAADMAEAVDGTT